MGIGFERCASHIHTCMYVVSVRDEQFIRVLECTTGRIDQIMR